MKFVVICVVVMLSVLASADEFRMDIAAISISNSVDAVEEAIKQCSHKSSSNCTILIERARDTIAKASSEVKAITDVNDDDDLAIANSTIIRAVKHFNDINLSCKDKSYLTKLYCTSSLLSASHIVTTSVLSQNEKLENSCRKSRSTLRHLFHSTRMLLKPSETLKEVNILMSEVASPVNDVMDLYCNQELSNPTECLINLQLVATAVNADIEEVQKSTQTCGSIDDPDCATHVGNADELLLALQPTIVNAQSVCTANVTSVKCFKDVSSVHSLVSKALIPMTEAVSHCKSGGAADACHSKLSMLTTQFTNMSAILTIADNDCNVKH